MIIVIRGNENQFGYLDCHPMNLTDNTQSGAYEEKEFGLL